MKRVLVLYYSQSGQLKEVVDSFCSDLIQSDQIEIDFCPIIPKTAFPYPWDFYSFFDAFPESVYMDGCEVEPIACNKEYDLIILGYSVWFLAPSLPITGFLKTPQAKALFKETPVITLIACRDMWVMAQEKMKHQLKELQARLIDNVVLTDQGGSLYAFVTTPRWMLTGKKDPFGPFPAAGVHPNEIKRASRFGKRIKEALLEGNRLTSPLLKGMGAVNVNGKLIASEKIATRSFMVWGKLIKKAGRSGSMGRKVVITIYALFLLLMVLTLVPLNIAIRKILAPFTQEKIEKMVAYYELPSGR